LTLPLREGQEPSDRLEPVAFNPYAPYGRPVESTFGVVIWNVGRDSADWRDRESGIKGALTEAAPDVVCLVEAWGDGETTQPELAAEKLGLAYHCFGGAWDVEG
jgi:hypothetical protein